MGFSLILSVGGRITGKCEESRGGEGEILLKQNLPHDPPGQA